MTHAPGPISKIRQRIVNRTRLTRARLAHKTVRFKVGDLNSFYRQLNEAEIPYCVLRWSEKVPFPNAAPEAFEHDVDHLIGRHVIEDICRIASELPGKAKCDFYSLNGERASAYATMPYLPPALAQEILDNRVLNQHPFYTPCATDAFFSFAFHLVYHKGDVCGVETGIENVRPNPEPVRDYKAELLRLAKQANVPLAKDCTLLDIHRLLHANRWNMPLDLMTRWPRRHPMLDALMHLDQTALAPLVEMVPDIYVFVLRSQSTKPQNKDLALDMISTRFTILDDLPLSKSEVQNLSRLTRGGNWIEKSDVKPILPTDIIVCQAFENRGPLPDGMSSEKVAKRYPHITNTDVLIKRAVRSALAKSSNDPKTQVSVHATDNAAETVETLLAVKGEATESYIRELLAKADKLKNASNQ